MQISGLCVSRSLQFVWGAHVVPGLILEGVLGEKSNSVRGVLSVLYAMLVVVFLLGNKILVPVTYYSVKGDL